MGITILSENIDYPPTRVFMGRGSDCRDLCAKVDSAAFRLIYDAAAHLFVNDDPQQTFSDMFPYAQHVHLKGYRVLDPDEQPERFREANDGKRYMGTTLDTGLVDISGIVAQLSRLNYQGFLQIEYQGVDDPRTALKHNVAYLRGLLARLAPASGASHS
jgi:sugar phosphate isomerase/epimerase